MYDVTSGVDQHACDDVLQPIRLKKNDLFTELTLQINCETSGAAKHMATMTTMNESDELLQRNMKVKMQAGENGNEINGTNRTGTEFRVSKVSVCFN